VKNSPDELAQLTKAINQCGGNLIALGTFLGDSSQNREVTFKVAGVNSQSLIAAFEPLVEHILDVREN
jgi:acetoin utilization protein AcuB